MKFSCIISTLGTRYRACTVIDIMLTASPHYDIIGDVHGCLPELEALLAQLGYQLEQEAGHTVVTAPPEGRMAVFLGDLVDRGPDTPGVLRLVMQMCDRGLAICVPGNHDMKFLRMLKGNDVQVTNGLAQSKAQMEETDSDFREAVIAFLERLTHSHYLLDEGRLVVAHAGLREELHGDTSAETRHLCLYGETNGEKDESGFPVRLDWAAAYSGRALVVYGHTPVPEALWRNNTIDIDTGCVYGGSLTALRYPECILVSVPARAQYAVSRRIPTALHTDI